MEAFKVPLFTLPITPVRRIFSPIAHQLRLFHTHGKTRDGGDRIRYGVGSELKRVWKC